MVRAQLELAVDDDVTSRGRRGRCDAAASSAHPIQHTPAALEPPPIINGQAGSTPSINGARRDVTPRGAGAGAGQS
jgi:hypothetical protein